MGGGGGGWALVPPYSYASDSGVLQDLLTGGGEVKEQSYRAGEGVGVGCPPPTVGIFLKMCVSKQHFGEGAIIRGRFCSGIDQFLAPSSSFLPPF